MKVLSACLGLVLERTSLREVLLRQATCDPSCDPPSWCGVATTLCAGEEEAPPWWRSSVVDFGRVTERDGGGAQDSVFYGHLPLLAGSALVV